MQSSAIMQERFSVMRYQAPNRASTSHRELGSGILGSFLTGSPFLGVQQRREFRTPAFNGKVMLIVILRS
jgi:hypothetical protein